MATTIKVECPKCGSDDCNFTREDSGRAIVARIGRFATVCNSCGYIKVAISIDSKEIFTETKLPGSDEIERKYVYLGQEVG